VTPVVRAALHELHALIVEGDDYATGWLLAIQWTNTITTTLGSYQRAAVRRLALSLGAGDVDGAERAALWITDPDRAMERALRDQRDGACLDGEARL